MALRMLYDGPKNGAELMDAIETMTRGRWRPSPGSVYPMLEDLTTERLVKKRDDGRYELTADARREFERPFGPRTGERNERAAEEVLRELEGYASYFEELKQGGKDEWKELRPKLRALTQRLAKLAEE